MEIVAANFSLKTFQGKRTFLATKKNPSAIFLKLNILLCNKNMHSFFIIFKMKIETGVFET